MFMSMYYLYSPISDSLREFMFMNNNGVEGLFDMAGLACIRTNNCFRADIPHDNLISAISDYLIDNKDSIRESSETLTELQSYRVLATFYSDPNSSEDSSKGVNVNRLISKYPLEREERIKRMLFNLNAVFTGDSISSSDLQNAYALLYSQYSGIHQTIAMLEARGYLHRIDGSRSYILTEEAIKIATEANLTRKPQAFIAMQFRYQNETEKTDLANIREAFKKAITKSGFSACVIDEKEHNDIISNRILKEIDNSCFTVVDLTYPNYGAYFEAGYARAHGPVIFCIRQDVFNNPLTKPHFDIVQYAMVMWNDYSDLVEKLSHRISETIK